MFRLSHLVVGLLALTLIFGMTAPLVAAEATGKIKSVEAAKNQFVLTDVNQKDWTFQLTKDAKIFVDDKDALITDLKKDQEATIKYDKDKEGNLMAMEVRCKTK